MLQPHTREHASRSRALGARTGRRPSQLCRQATA